MRCVTSVLVAMTDSTRSLGAMVVEVGAGDVGVAEIKVSSLLGEPQLVARTTRSMPKRIYRVNDLDMSASADAGIVNSDVDELCMWILPKIEKFQKLTIGI